MLKDLIKQSWLTEDEIILQINDDYDRGYYLAQGIRKEYEEEDKLFNYQKKNKDKIGDSTLYNIHCAYMAREYIDKPTGYFQPHYNGNRRLTDNLNLAMKTDFNTSYMENLIYDQKHDKYLRGHGSILRNGWDGVNKMPYFEVVDPRLEILDPDGNYRNGDYSFYGFEQTEYKKNMTVENKFEAITDDINLNTTESEVEKVKERDQAAFDMNSSPRNQSKSNPAISLYAHMAYFGKWEKQVRALVWLANGVKDIVKVHILPEPKNWVRAFDDILAITYYRPRSNNPYGDRFARYAKDAQVVKSILANLRLFKVQAELYPTYLRNTRLIKERGDIDFWLNKVIDANPMVGENLNNALVPIQKDLRADNSYILDDSIDRQIEWSTSIGRITTGSTTERREWVGTNELIQNNTDVNLGLAYKIDAIGYERLLFVWLGWYLEKFKDGDKKIVFFKTSGWSLSREFTREEFLTDQALKITVDTVLEIQDRLKKEQVTYAQSYALMETLDRPIASKNASMRNYLRALGMSTEDIYEQVPETAQELVAQMNVQLLMEGQFIEVKSDYDPDTHLIAIKSAGYNLNVELYKRGLLWLKKIQWEKRVEKTQQDEAVRNNVVAQGMSQIGNAAQQL